MYNFIIKIQVKYTLFENSKYFFLNLLSLEKKCWEIVKVSPKYTGPA